MLAASRDRIERLLPDHALVLDVGGWASPLPRADWVLDLLPYETRGLYGPPVDETSERFNRATWIERDICDRAPWPFEDGQFDFAVCSQTLEDVRDPIWVCGELIRVAKAGYIEVPSRLEEQCYGVQGSWVGWSHHRWLVDVSATGIDFVFKPHLLAARDDFHFPAERAASLAPGERVQTLFWESSFEYRERIFTTPAELDSYLADFVARHGGPAPAPGVTLSRLGRVLKRVRR